MKNKMKEKNIFRKFCLDSSILGLKYFYLYPNIVSRLYWALVMISSVVFACLLTYALYKRFEAMPTRITIETQHEPINDLPFPAITLCTPNQITVSSALHFNSTLVDGNRTLSLEYLVKLLLGYYEPVHLDKNALQELQDLIDVNRYTIPEVMAALPQSCDQFLKLCYFNQRLHPCKKLFKPILTHHGFCCIFNSMYSFKDNRRNEVDPHFKYHTVRKNGLQQGLTVITDFQPEEAVNGTLIFAGATRILLTSWNEFPADDESSLVVPASEAYFPISAVHTYCSEDAAELPWHIRKCYFEHEHELPFFSSYHNSDCDLFCYVLEVEEQCHCQLFYVPRVRLSRACNISSIACITEVQMDMNGPSAEHMLCPRDCNSLKYRTQMAIGNLDALPYLYYKSYDGIVFNQSTSLMHFFFPGPVYTKQKQETVMSLTTLSSNLGGVFGLCLGCSVISAIEIGYYLYTCIKNRIKSKINKALLKRKRNVRIAYIN